MQRAADETHDAKKDTDSYLESAKKEGAKIIESAQNLMHQASDYIHEHTGSHKPAEPATTKPPQ